MPGLTQNSKAAKLLHKKFEAKELTGNEVPKEVWESEEALREHKPKNFRTCFYNVRKDYPQNAQSGKFGHIKNYYNSMLYD